MLEANLVAESDLGEIGLTGWSPPDGMSFDEWARAINGFIDAQNSMNWIIGDGLNFGERKWGETYAQAILVTDWSYQRLADAKWVSAAVPPANRRADLSWTHHRYVAKLPPVAQDEWLARAEEGAWSTSELKRSLNGQSAASAIEIVAEMPKRDAKRLFIELSTIVATGEDAGPWINGLTAQEMKEEVHKVFVMAHRLLEIAEKVYDAPTKL